jgi:hypothetical protein
MASVLLGLALLLQAGCNTNPNMAHCEGTITIDGEPYEGVEITFDPQFEGGSQSIGITDADGHYEAMFTAQQDGIMIGKHLVMINATQYDDQGNETVIAEIPPKYAEESEVEVEIEPGNNTFDLDVKTTE